MVATVHKSLIAFVVICIVSGISEARIKRDVGVGLSAEIYPSSNGLGSILGSYDSLSRLYTLIPDKSLTKLLPLPDYAEYTAYSVGIDFMTVYPPQYQSESPPRMNYILTCHFTPHTFIFTTYKYDDCSYYYYYPTPGYEDTINSGLGYQ